MMKELVCFWRMYWFKRIKDFREMNDTNLKIDNPHLLLVEIVAEINYNSFKSRENRKLFKDLLGACLRNDPVFSSLYRRQCAYANSHWDKAPLTVKAICEEILVSMNKGHYLNTIAAELTKTIDEAAAVTDEVKDEICRYTDLLITEFMAFGLDINDIAEFLQIESDGYAGVKPMEVRSAKEDIKLLMKRFKGEDKNGMILIRLQGAKANMDYHIYDLHFYSVDAKRYITGKAQSDIENQAKDWPFVNVAIPAVFTHWHTTLNDAKARVSKMLDFISLNLMHKEELKVDDRLASIVVDGNEVFCPKKSDEDIPVRNFLSSYQLENIADVIKKISEEKISGEPFSKNDDFSRLANAAHWFNKAAHAERAEDRLLYSWISLESILKMDAAVRDNILCDFKEDERGILTLAKEICAGMMANTRFYLYAAMGYTQLHLTTIDGGNPLKLPDEVIEELSLAVTKGVPVSHKKFLQYLPGIIAKVDDEMIRLELRKVQKFYADINGIKSYYNEVCDDLSMIYRLRNLIAHNAAHQSQMTLLYAYKAQQICGNLLLQIKAICQKRGCSLSEALVKFHAEMKVFKANWEENLAAFTS